MVVDVKLSSIARECLIRNNRDDGTWKILTDAYTNMIRWQRSRRRKQHLALVGALFCIFLFLLTSNDRYGYGGITLYRRQVHANAVDPLHMQHVELWKSLYSLMLNNNPQCENRPELVVPREPHVTFSSDHEHARPDVLWMNEADLSRMKSAHKNFVNDIRSMTTKLAYNVGTRGIVTTASDELLITLTISLSMLRRTGSNLPVEVFLDKPSQYTEDYCSKILRPLNAKCRFLTDIFLAAESSIDLHSYQFKIFSIIFSSFEDVLLLDSDAWPVARPDLLFESLPFTDSGLVLWPDFWYASESPYFFEIAKIENVQPLNQRPATESGEILYSKAKHSRSLMLATYYNFYGPEYYYLLHSQGGPGEGDKETYVWAATALGEDFYFVKQGVSSLGRHDSSGDYIGTAMVQSNPVQDYAWNVNTPARRTIKDPFEVAHPAETKPTLTSPKPLFLHANHPKFNPYAIFDKDEKYIHEPVQDSNGEWVRSWLPREEAIQFFGMDIEGCFWKTIHEVTCDTLRGIGLSIDTYDKAGKEVIRQRDRRVCEKMETYLKQVFSDVF